MKPGPVEGAPQAGGAWCQQVSAACSACWRACPWAGSVSIDGGLANVGSQDFGKMLLESARG